MKKEKIKMFMKFDVGKKGFEEMILLLAASSIVVLLLGLYFVFKVLLPSFQSV